MKLKKTMLVIGCTLVFSLIGKQMVKADSEIDKLEPNQYEEDEFKENTDYLHEESLYETRKSIPEEQKGLTFEPSKNSMQGIKDRLFEEPNDPPKTIVTKAAQLKLFTNASESYAEQENNVEHSGMNNTIITLYVVIILMATLVVFILLVPRMTRNGLKGEQE